MKLSELLGTELPVIQAPMAGVQGSEMAAAVSNAGGLGSLPCGMLTAETLRDELEKIVSVTSKPFNVNFFCHKLPDIDPEKMKAWEKALAPYYEELGLDPESIPETPMRSPFNNDMADVLSDYNPRVVSFHFGLPSDELLKRVKDMGAKVLSTATTVDEALWLEDQGVDAVIAQGLEAGGHRGNFLTHDISMQVGTFALVSQISKAVKLPVIAAGGISDEAGVAAALALGASGVQAGTVYLLCPEASTKTMHRKALVSPEAHHTAITNIFSGRPARGIVNRIIREIGPLSNIAPPFPLAAKAFAPIRAKAESMGIGDFSPLWSGQNVAGCVEIPAADITRKLAAGVS